MGIGQADIKGFFDSIDHQRLLLAVDKHVKEDWQRLYIRRWLAAPVQHADGRLEARTQGTPQGGVISPLPANLHLHYTFDAWIGRHWEGVQFERYADDIVCHCRTEQEAKALKALLTQRFADCGLALHPGKTKIVYGKSHWNQRDYACVSFDFLGYTFKPRLIKTRQGPFRVCFLPAVSQKAAKRIRSSINEWPWHKWEQQDIVVILATVKRSYKGGWIIMGCTANR